MSDTKITQTLCTAEEAIKLVNRRNGQHLRVCVRMELPIIHEEGKCFSGYSLVKVDRKEARTFIKLLISRTLESRGARIVMEETEYLEGSLKGVKTLNIGG